MLHAQRSHQITVLLRLGQGGRTPLLADGFLQCVEYPQESVKIVSRGLPSHNLVQSTQARTRSRSGVSTGIQETYAHEASRSSVGAALNPSTPFQPVEQRGQG